MSNSLWSYRCLFCPWGFTRQEYRSGLPFPYPRDLSDPEVRPDSETHSEIYFVVQLLSCAWLFATPWTEGQASLSFTILLEYAQMHVHWVSDAIQSSHPLPPSSPPAFYLSQYQGLFQTVSSSHKVAKVLELQLKHQSFQRKFRVDFL